MKYIIVTFIIFLSIFACNSKKQKSDINSTPLIIQKAFYQNWYGGREGVTGINIEISAKLDSKDCIYQTAYYLNKKAKINTKKNGEFIVLKANINTSTRRDRMLSSDRDKEYGNEAPTKSKYPNLTKNQTVIEYTQNGKLKHFTVDLVEKEALYYP